MTILEDFFNAAFGQSREIRGSDLISISGGQQIKACTAERNYVRDSDINGFELGHTSPLVVKTDEFTSAYPGEPEDYLGKLVRWDGVDWRIQDINKGDFTSTITVISENQVG